MNPTIVLFGLRGSGKTTLGRLLAVQLGSEFVDLDERVRARMKAASLAEAFRRGGELAFRQAECAELEEFLKRDGQPVPAGARVLALGGGTPTYEASRELLTRASNDKTIRMILLEAAPEVLGARVSAAPGDRPLLAGASFAEEARLLSERRLPTYRQLAHAVVRTDQATDVALQEIRTVSTRPHFQ